MLTPGPVSFVLPCCDTNFLRIKLVYGNNPARGLLTCMGIVRGGPGKVVEMVAWKKLLEEAGKGTPGTHGLILASILSAHTAWHTPCWARFLSFLHLPDPSQLHFKLHTQRPRLVGLLYPAWRRTGYVIQGPSCQLGEK